MLKIINDLEPFFEDCYRRINVREYARIKKISPPTASRLLEDYKKNGILKKEIDRRFFYYFANKDSDIFGDLSRMYWKIRFKQSGLIEFLENKFLNPMIILFGSLSKCEAKIDSDIDISIFVSVKKEIDLKEFEKKLKRKIQLFVFKNRNEVKSQELLNNILNGYKIWGEW
jgi:predicted nucleotidyltransferase